MITSKINLPIPGGWAKEAPEHQQSDIGEDSVAAGVVSTTGEVVDEAEKTVAKITEGKPKDLVGNVVLSTGEILNDDGSVVGKAVPADSPKINKGDQTSTEKARSGVNPATDDLPNGTDVEPAESEAQDEPLDAKSDVAKEAREAKEDVSPADVEEKPVESTDDKLATISNPDDAIIKDDETAPEELEKDAEKDVDNAGKRDSAVDLSKADINSQLDDAKSTATGQDGVIPLPDPFEKFPGARVNEDGKIIFDDQSIGVVAEGDVEKLAGKTVDAEGNIRNEETGTVIGKGELKEELQEELKDAANSFSILKGAKVNKGGNLVNDKGQAIGRITEGILKHLIGKKADENGQIWNESGKVIGKAEPIPDTELEELKDRPFEDFPDAVVGSDGKITSNGEVIGRLLDGEGDAKKLKGKKVDSEGEILDSQGNVIGKAERWEEPKEPEPEPEPEADRSILAGKRVNKAGNIVDSHGQIFGRVIEGDAKRMVGRMCDKKGNILSESGDILGKGEVVPEGEREGYKEGPFSELSGCTVSKDGKVVTPSGDVVGRLIKGDAKALVGRPVDEDGDILDRNGNSLGRAERWEEPVVEKTKNALSGRKVNREGNVLSPEGDVIGKLTSGDLQICSGQEVDDDGDVVNGKGATIGHVSLLADIPEPEKVPEPEPEPTETPEEKTKREEAEKDEKLAKQMSGAVQQCLDRVRPICKLITQKVEAAERKPKEELDEDLLVKEVKPLIEEGNKILTEANGVIRALDPDGHIQNNAKSKSHTRDASPAEYHLADVLKELTGTVTECIDNAKKKIEGMPHAKKELNPLWGLMTEPLFQILAAVGLLLNGVLELVGRLLSGLGLGGIVNNLLGGLGLTNVLKSLGAGGVVSALTGQNKKK